MTSISISCSFLASHLSLSLPLHLQSERKKKKERKIMITSYLIMILLANLVHAFCEHFDPRGLSHIPMHKSGERKIETDSTFSYIFFKFTSSISTLGGPKKQTQIQLLWLSNNLIIIIKKNVFNNRFSQSKLYILTQL